MTKRIGDYHGRKKTHLNEIEKLCGVATQCKFMQATAREGRQVMRDQVLYHPATCGKPDPVDCNA